MKTKSHSFNKLKDLALACFWFCLVGLPAFSQSLQLSLEEALELALKHSPALRSALLDVEASQAKVYASHLRKLPQLGFMASYQRLSEVPPSSVEMPNPFNPNSSITFEFPPSLLDHTNFSFNLQFPFFAGFRLSEAARLSELNLQGRLLNLEQTKRTLIFEVRRAYWENLRAQENTRLLFENLSLAQRYYELTRDRQLQGTATQADLLNALNRLKQAELDLSNAFLILKKAFLNFANLIGIDTGDFLAENSRLLTNLLLSTDPLSFHFDKLPTDLDEKALLALGLSRRPELRQAQLLRETAQHNLSLAQADFYPSLSLIGNITIADPNPRVAFQTESGNFTTTWSIGVQLTYNLGALPSTFFENEAGLKNLAKSETDLERQQDLLTLDIQSCILTVKELKLEVDLLEEMTKSAEENFRIMTERNRQGLITELELNTSRLAYLRARFQAFNSRINLAIAQADLLRATALEDLN